MASMFDGIIGSSQICSRWAALHPFAREARAMCKAAGDLIPEDRVELSEAAGEGNHGQDAQRIRHESVERIRRSIAAGDYLTSEKIDATVERLYEELLGQRRFRDAEALPRVTIGDSVRVDT
jgi:anti-sigma28 factor (negative regulator of flagellin synthesis)